MKKTWIRVRRHVKVVVYLSWTNWTFGIWWGRPRKRAAWQWGVDLGPLEFVITPLFKRPSR